MFIQDTVAPISEKIIIYSGLILACAKPNTGPISPTAFPFIYISLFLFCSPQMISRSKLRELGAYRLAPVALGPALHLFTHCTKKPDHLLSFITLYEGKDSDEHS